MFLIANHTQIVNNNSESFYNEAYPFRPFFYIVII